MKYLFLPFIVLFLTTTAFGQVSKVYITSDNKYSDDAINAVSYILVSKTPDSLYFVQQFDMQDSITMEATYKDMQLSVQQGEYKLYKLEKQVQTIKFDYSTKKLDTTIIPKKNYLCTKGYYINGIKEGKWIDYFRDGGKAKLNTFHSGKLNGPFMTYGHGNKTAIEGSYLNGRLNGIWYTFTFKGDTSVIDYYSDGVLKKRVSHFSDKKFKSTLRSGNPPYQLTDYLNKKLSLADKNTILNGYHGSYKFTLTIDGKLVNAVVENVIDLKVDTHIIEALLLWTSWKPATIDKKAVASQFKIDVAPLTQNGKIVGITAWMSGPTVHGYDGYYDGK